MQAFGIDIENDSLLQNTHGMAGTMNDYLHIIWHLVGSLMSLILGVDLTNTKGDPQVQRSTLSWHRNKPKSSD